MVPAESGRGHTERSNADRNPTQLASRGSRQLGGRQDTNKGPENDWGPHRESGSSTTRPGVRDIRALDPSNPVQMAWMNSDLHSNCFAAVIPTEQYDLTNDEFATVAATNAGMPNPACLEHLGVRLVRPKAGDETAGDEDGADAPPGSTVDAFGFNSARGSRQEEGQSGLSRTWLVERPVGGADGCAGNGSRPP